MCRIHVIIEPENDLNVDVRIGQARPRGSNRRSFRCSDFHAREFLTEPGYEAFLTLAIETTSKKETDLADPRGKQIRRLVESAVVSSSRVFSIRFVTFNHLGYKVFIPERHCIYLLSLELTCYRFSYNGRRLIE